MSFFNSHRFFAPSSGSLSRSVPLGCCKATGVDSRKRRRRDEKRYFGSVMIGNLLMRNRRRSSIRRITKVVRSRIEYQRVSNVVPRWICEQRIPVPLLTFRRAESIFVIRRRQNSRQVEHSRLPKSGDAERALESPPSKNSEAFRNEASLVS